MSGSLRHVLIGAALAAISAAAQAQTTKFVVLAPTGQVRDGLPVLAQHPDPAAARAVLERGFSGRMLHLYALEQQYLHRKDGRVVEPAYLVLSNRQGGFPQFGFYLGNDKKPDVGWVDLHRGSKLEGQFGAMDQIFPHELLHVIVRQLAGEPRESGGNQVHAIGVRTDPVTAFEEGFAETMQILAIDDPDATDATRQLRTDGEARDRANAEVARFGRELGAPFWLLQPSRMRFLIWFSQSEQVLRYYAVKDNAFANVPVVPPRLLERDDKYPAYLFASVVPGTGGAGATAIRKPAGALLSSEAVVSHLFWRLVTDQALQHRTEAAEFYAEFGARAEDIAPVENVFLKIFVALDRGRPSTSADLLRSYARLFPADAADVSRISAEVLGSPSLPEAPEIWLVSDGLTTGTSLFDQFRAMPRPHTFDANAAVPFDWLTVSGVTESQAAALVRSGPYRDLPDLLASLAMSGDLKPRVERMAAAMQRLRDESHGSEGSLSLWSIARSYLWRIGVLVALATAAGTWLARRAGARRWWTAAPIALAASVLVIISAWIVIGPVWLPLASPVALGGVPWTLWRVARRRPASLALRPIAVWLAASVPALAIIAVPALFSR